jgi:ABC-type phosphate/phosphonate transport system ATPase subunit
LLADEPVANLNEDLAARVLERLRDEARARKAVVVCVLHHEDQVRQFADVALRFGPNWPNGAYWERIS